MNRLFAEHESACLIPATTRHIRYRPQLSVDGLYFYVPVLTIKPTSSPAMVPFVAIGSQMAGPVHSGY